MACRFLETATFRLGARTRARPARALTNGCFRFTNAILTGTLARPGQLRSQLGPTLHYWKNSMATHRHRWGTLNHIGTRRWGLVVFWLGAFASCSPGSEEGSEILVERVPVEPDGPTGPDGPVMISMPTEEDLVLVEAPPPPFCGDGALNDDEQCDDAGTEGGDGCSANCLVVEQGFQCATPGASCEQAAICGDSLLLAGETCDDSNA